ncbi:RDD family protein [Rhodococcoides yunnanense]|uniref:RDD family protein n=1 Tax=Rhodococcoides yunnanense TaxID=278209 RepID=UPI00093437C0|nr:RDD family protein [Rhodococcus yunnanensis]
MSNRAVAPPTEAERASLVPPPPSNDSIVLDAQLLPASRGLRPVATVIDFGAVAFGPFAFTMLGLALSNSAVAVIVGPLSAVCVWIWLVVWNGVRGLSFGKAALGLRLADSATFRPVGVGRSIARSLVFLSLPGLSALSTFFDSSGLRRGWHDRVARTVVIDVVKGANPIGPQIVTTAFRKPDRGVLAVASPVPVGHVPPSSALPPPPPPPSGTDAMSS